ncbi:hypothetical protein ACFL59_00605, partial [Planctomycetota bacterium]
MEKDTLDEVVRQALLAEVEEVLRALGQFVERMTKGGNPVEAEEAFRHCMLSVGGRLLGRALTQAEPELRSAIRRRGCYRARYSGESAARFPRLTGLPFPAISDGRKGRGYATPAGVGGRSRPSGPSGPSSPSSRGWLPTPSSHRTGLVMVTSGSS